MPLRWLFLVGFLVSALVGPAPARADDAAADSASTRDASDSDLREVVEELQREVALLRRKLEVQEEATAAKGPQPLVGAGPDGFYLRSADRSFDLKLRGYTQFDGRYFAQSDGVVPGNWVDTWLFRRVRPILEGTLGGVVDFRIMPDFANSTLVLQDAWANLKYFEYANVQAGKFKAPFGLERLQSATALSFAERALPTNLVPNRDLGLMLHGNLGEGILQYQVAFMNGVIDGGSADTDNGNGKDVVARIFGHPFQSRTEAWLSGLGLGFAFNYGAQDTPGPVPVYRTAGQVTFFSYLAGTQQSGDRLRLSPHFYYYWGPFGMMGEYVRSRMEATLLVNQESFVNQAWQVTAGWVLTGENASYKGVIPRSSFSPQKGTLGAFEAVARYNEFYVDPEIFDDGFANPAVSAERARSFGVGVNWYLNRWIKLAFDYDRTFFKDGAGTLANVQDREDESVFFLRTQLAF